MIATDSRKSTVWLFSKNVDLAAFLVTPMLALVAVFILWSVDRIDLPLPPWGWILLVLAVDVAHVHSTWFRVYLDPSEWREHRELYLTVPVVCYVTGVLLYHTDSMLFWTILAYIAVFHFVRQQVGWVRLYAGKAGSTHQWDRGLDTGAVYAATLWPILVWHTRLPREFAWLMDGDFVSGVPSWVAWSTFPIYVGFLSAFFVRQIYLYVTSRQHNWGKIIVVATTAATWLTGIVLLNSDVAFTITNVLPHGIPYVILIWFYINKKPQQKRAGITRRVWSHGVWLFLSLILLFAFCEEMVWDKAVWHDHPQFFGAGFSAQPWWPYLVPLLALPQVTHYVLDGYIWRRRTNPELHRQVILT